MYQRCDLALQVSLVESCIEADDLKQAVSAGRRFGLLQDAFPTLEHAYRQRTLGRLAGKRQWAVAAALAGNDAQLQVRILNPGLHQLWCGIMVARAFGTQAGHLCDACTLRPSSSPKP